MHGQTFLKDERVRAPAAAATAQRHGQTLNESENPTEKLLTAASPAAATAAAGLQNVPFATPKHHGPEGRTSPRSAPKKVSNVASETLETEQKIGTQTRPNGAAAAAVAAAATAAASAASPAAATGARALKHELIREAYQKSV